MQTSNSSLPLVCVDCGCQKLDEQFAQMDAVDLNRNEQRFSCCKSDFPQERYIVTAKATPNMQNHSEAVKRNQESSNEDLVRLLILKPEIAGRPRDNIIFDGDMDLKTTFESSYEALAKMRLDEWKKYQNLHHSAKDEDSENNKSDSKEGEELNKFNKIIEGKNNSDLVEEKLPEPLKRRTSNGISERGYRKVSYEKTDHDEEASEFVDSISELANNKTCEQTIDPDLSPLIIYNANMNRLDTLGLRRRSKYRPSTTLKAGARGLFGDLEQEVRYVGKHKSNPEVGERTRNRLERAPIKEGDRTEASKTPTKEEVMMERVLDARNLRDTEQPNNLVFPDSNRPIDSKRKLVNNINMVDHIKDQDIVGTRYNSQLNDGQDLIDNLMILEQNLNDLKLARAEEAAAVKELQQIDDSRALTSDELIGQTEQIQEGQPKECSMQEAGHKCCSRHENLHESRERLNLGQEKGIVQLDSKAKPSAYINLFRESPDFLGCFRPV